MRSQIVVGLNDSPSSKAGLQWAAEQAKSTGAVLRAVHALGRPYGFAAPDIPLTVEPTELTPEETPDTRRTAITSMFEAVSPHRDWVLGIRERVRGRGSCAPIEGRAASCGRHPRTRRTRSSAGWVGEPLLPQPRCLPGGSGAGAPS
jgi:hypothetical protein